jgi:branched-chain amino acid transport system ATP-binding protein
LAREILQLAGVQAYYGDSHVLHDVSFSLQEGQLLGLLGRNGAGKTTCMSSIMGFLSRKGGTIQLDGQVISGLAAESISRRGVSLVPQGRRVFRSLTVHENLLVAGQPPRDRGATRRWTHAEVYKIFPRLGERAQQTAGSLSGGEQQMLAVGRALMGNPRVLLMDEPSEGLAPQIVAELGKTIGWLRDEGLSIVLVEQNVKLAFELADAIVMMNTGRVSYRGTAKEAQADTDAIDQNLGVF